jgi:hypothetical protein
MRGIYFDCFSGASGDMIIGALLDAGLPLDALRAELDKLKLPGCRVEARRVERGGLAGTKFDVVIDGHEHAHRGLGSILEMIDASALSDRVKRDSARVFRRLAEAEAKVHNTHVEEVHFHEVGAVDAIIDVTGACIGLERLGVGHVAVSALPTGRGFVRCAHGRLPVPAPATAALLVGFPLAPSEVESELTTPTGAAILTTLGETFGVRPAMTLEAVGFGAGAKDFEGFPNLLRVFVGQVASSAESDRSLGGTRDRVRVLETNIDDMPAQVYEVVFEKLFAAGALDVWTTPIQMKKGRPAVMLSAIVPEAARAAAEEAIFRETTTFGIRSYEADRRKLERESARVQTEFGAVGVKIGRLGGRVVTVSPEYEDCRRIASERGVALKDVCDRARLAARNLK